MKKIAIIGVGIMGRGMAANFLKKGYTVYLWNRHPEKLEALVKQGGIMSSSPKAATEAAEIVFEVTADDTSSRAVWLGEGGILAGAGPQTIAMACSTLSMEWVGKLILLASERNIGFLDMPMTGGRKGAEEGRLTLLAGGNGKILEAAKSDLAAISEKIIHFGPAGSGMRYKLLLNMLQGIHIAGFGEVLRLAETSGMDLKAVGDALAERPGGTTTNLAWRDYQKKPDPINFSVGWMAKDLDYAKRMASEVPTPLLDETLDQYREACRRGLASEDWTRVTKK